MSDYIISRRLSSDRLYAYYKSRFWFWDEERCIWKESHLMSQRFEREHNARHSLTPEQFMADLTKFQPLDEYELASTVLDALENAKPCKTAPVEPVVERPTPSAQCSDAATAAEGPTAASPAVPEESSPTTETVPAAQNAAIPASAGEGSAARSAISDSSLSSPAAPTFDYTQFDEQTAQALQNFAFRALQVARTYYRDLMEIVVGAHKLLCGPLVPDGNNSRYGNRGEDTFRAWCASVHINRTKAYQLLQIQSFMDTCTPEEQSTLALLPFTAMRELVTGDTPEQVITMAKEGKVGTSKEVLELKAQLKAEKERADTAEAHLSAANADINGLRKQNGQLREQADAAEAREEEAWKLQSKAEARAKEAESQLVGSRQVAEAAKLRADKLKAENDALKKQPITAVVDEEEVDRRAGEKAYEIAAGMTADYKVKQEQDARDAYDSIILAGRSITSIVQSTKLQFRKLPDDQRESAINQLVHTLASAQGEVSACL